MAVSSISRSIISQFRLPQACEKASGKAGILMKPDFMDIRNRSD